MLFMDLATTDALKIGDVIIKLVHKSGKRARLQIEAHPDIKVEKVDKEVKEQLERE